MFNEIEVIIIIGFLGACFALSGILVFITWLKVKHRNKEYRSVPPLQRYATKEELEKGVAVHWKDEEVKMPPEFPMAVKGAIGGRLNTSNPPRGGSGVKAAPRFVPLMFHCGELSREAARQCGLRSLHQAGLLSLEDYKQALLQPCRVVKIDCREKAGGDDDDFLKGGWGRFTA